MTTPADQDGANGKAKSFDEEGARELFKDTRDAHGALKQATNGWLAASTVAYCAAGLLLALNPGELLDYSQTAILAFAAGLWLSFVTGILYSIATGKLWDIHDEFLDLLKMPVVERDPAVLQKAADNVANHNIHNRPAILFGLMTIGCAVVGSIALGSTLHGEDLANDKRCAAIQRDMLSSRPQRADGPDLFQALGCHPQGKGDVFAPRPGGRL